ncbi:hypothetical protein GGS24DRAFT_507803 [Hypoxylon argillaceum]|nr:hypothetical protein GGS24DRAFT_507803 [Hypoxylon argillaceum]
MAFRAELFDIVSPRLTYQDRYSWTRPLSQIYSVVRRMGIMPSDFWGTRIHIGPAGAFYQWQINAIAKSVIQHNNGFSALGWDLWRNAIHADARTRLWIPEFSSETRVDVYRAESAISPEEVARLMDRGGAVSHIRPWNFWPLVPLLYSFTGFLEYNLAPGSRTEQDAYMWINFVCLFVRGAIQSNGNWTGGSSSGGQRALFIEGDLQIFILEQADEVNLPEMERESLRQRLDYLGGLY